MTDKEDFTLEWAKTTPAERARVPLGQDGSAVDDWLRDRPATRYLLTTPPSGYWSFGPGQGECVDCPFATFAGHRNDEYRGDRAKHDYVCALLDRTVWGAEPLCTIQDWKVRAQREVANLGVGDSGL